jgi:sugar phosphate isomerase/epimerase
MESLKLGNRYPPNKEKPVHCTRPLLFAAISVTLLNPVALSAGPDAKPAWPPRLYGFCMDLPAVPNPSIADQAGLLKELGFDGVGYPLWFGEEFDKNLRTLDEAGLQLDLAYTSINLDPHKPAFDPRVPQSLAKLKGRPVTVSVLIRGFPPGDPQGMEPAVKILRELADLAAKSDLKISIYHHLNDWTESLLFALKVVEKVDRPNLGVNFNLCHWLKVDGDKDYRPVLSANHHRIFAVTINGAQLGATAWTGGLIQPLDRGDFDNRELLAVLKEIGYTGPVGLMCYGIPDDTRQHLARSMNTWKSWQEP